MNGFIARILRLSASPRFPAVVPDIAVPPSSIAAFRAPSFPAAGPAPWLDAPFATDRIEAQRAEGRLDALQASIARRWARDGFVALESFFDAGRLHAAWVAYERALVRGDLTPDAAATEADPLPGRTLNPHFQVPELAALLSDSSVVDLVSMLLGAQAVPFQTIMGHKGSEQRAHSDAIHMTTYPLGYLAAAWIAFEDIMPGAGPLVYYPGSHRLPYVFSDDVGISGEEFDARGYAAYHERYEPRIAELIEFHALQPRYFLPRKGDVLLWHANLIHGGSPRASAGSSRRALVCHYFAKGCVTYHDLAGRPSHLHANV